MGSPMYRVMPTRDCDGGARHGMLRHGATWVVSTRSLGEAELDRLGRGGPGIPRSVEE